MRIRLAFLLCAVVALVGVGVPAFADVAPAASDLELPTAPVVLYATVGSSLSISVVAVPGTNPIASVVADFSAQVPRTPTSAWTDAISGVPMTTTNGTLYTLTVPIPRNASPGPWTVRVTVTDDHGEQGTNAAAVNVVQNTHLSLHYNPAVPRDIGIVTFTGKLTSMQPATTHPATADGSYIPYPGKTFTLVLAGEDFQFTTDRAGGYRFASTFATTFLASATFAGTIYRAPATSGPVTITMVRDATRIIDFKVSPNPMYRNAFVTISGTLQENDPNGPDWLPYLVRRTVVLVRSSVVHYETTVRTSRGGHSPAGRTSDPPCPVTASGRCVRTDPVVQADRRRQDAGEADTGVGANGLEHREGMAAEGRVAVPMRCRSARAAGVVCSPRQAHSDPMTAQPPRGPYRVPIEVLEAQSQVPREKQHEAQVPDQKAEGPSTWDEERRQAQLAGGA